jgi:hypothetical protein
VLNVTGEEYKSLTVDFRVKYLNGLMLENKSPTSIFKDLGIDKSQSKYLKKHGYILKENEAGIKQYIKTEPTQTENIILEGQESIFKLTESHAEPRKEVERVSVIPKGKTSSEPLQSKDMIQSFINGLKEKQVIKQDKQGRPGKEGRTRKTLYLEEDKFKKIHIWAIQNGCSASDVFNMLSEYFLNTIK